MSTVIETLLARNDDFRAHRHAPTLKMLPSLRTLVVGCVDPRVDPAYVLGLQAGEAAVIRNVGGRITPSALATLAMLRQVSKSAGGDLAAGWNLVLLHHTDCGIKRLGGAPELVSAFFGVPPNLLPDQAVDDPHASLLRDVAALQAADEVSGDVLVSGLLYDVVTGSIELVVPPAALRPTA